MTTIYLIFSILGTIMLVGIAFGQTDPDDSFAIYLLPKKDKANSWGDPNAYFLDEIKLTGKPFISQEDIWYYNKDSRRIFTYSRSNRELITMNYELVSSGRKLSISAEGIPFVAVIGKTPVYTGAFWLNISSYQFNGIAITPSGVEGSFLIWQVNYGYPTERFFQRREYANAINDPKILRAFEKDGKLYEDLEVVATCVEVRPTGKRRQSFIIKLEVTSVTKGNFAGKEIVMELWDSPDVFGEAVEDENYKFKKIDTKKRFKVRFEKQVIGKGTPRLLFKEAASLDRN